MRPFRYARVDTPAAALASVASESGARFIAGGTNVLDLMKDTVEAPTLLVDINALPYGEIVESPTMLRIGALARMSDTADHPAVKRIAPAVSEALLLSASAQLRNAGSIGGNLMQRTRCAYFRDVANACNKREPGLGCAAIGGENRQHAILGTSPACICTHPSDFATALLTTDALVRVRGPRGDRAIAIADFHTLPGATPNVETVLRHGELIYAVDVPVSALAASSRYMKIRDRASYEFALVSVAAALDVRDGTIADARLGLGGVAPKPWRAREAERSLIGAKPTAHAFERAAEIAVRDARGFGHNDFKIPLVRRTIAKNLAAVAQA
jgi:xanthine dehydrogenase YagS FAD-binding subunit